jgi:uncharacterized membrane-anchored protein
MNKYKTAVVCITTLAILGLINFSIWQKETHLSQGEYLFLTLVPVDPRSIMQGDYMTLRFQLGNEIRNAIRLTSSTAMQSEVDTKNTTDDKYTNEESWYSGFIEPQQGMVVVTLDPQYRASFVSLFKENQVLTSKQRKLAYKVRESRVKFATNAFFFEEGDASLFENAKYGEFAVNTDGEVLLSGMYDENLQRLGEGKY